MKKILKTATTVIPMLLLLSCATLSREECLTADWYDLGIRDGQTGEPLARLQQHREACFKYNVHIDAERYRAGRERGLTQYCSDENAFYTGLNGYAYHNVCPPEIDNRFRHYHAVAYEVYKIRSAIESVDNEIVQKDNQLHDEKHNDKQKSQLRRELRHLDRKRSNLRDELFYRERDYERQREEALRNRSTY